MIRRTLGEALYLKEAIRGEEMGKQKRGQGWARLWFGDGWMKVKRWDEGASGFEMRDQKLGERLKSNFICPPN